MRALRCRENEIVLKVSMEGAVFSRKPEVRGIGRNRRAQLAHSLDYSPTCRLYSTSIAFGDIAAPLTRCTLEGHRHEVKHIL